ncbi:MAG: hypothetical protein V8T86_12905 [Victivallis sp.]
MAEHFGLAIFPLRVLISPGQSFAVEAFTVGVADEALEMKRDIELQKPA